MGGNKKVDQKWLEQQTEKVGTALARQGIRLVSPVREASFRKPTLPIKKEDIASYIDHTLLKPTASRQDIRQLCEEARKYGFAAVCVNPGHVFFAAQLLAGSETAVCTVIGFPLGAATTLSKVAEVRDAIANGAHELDMVINLGSLLEGNYAGVYSDIKAVRDAAPRQILKVILETGYLSKEQIVRGCILAKMAGADFVKTCTGFGPGSCSTENVALMRQVVGQDFGVKASGGVRDIASAEAMIKAGANRIGASAGIAIVQGLGGG